MAKLTTILSEELLNNARLLGRMRRIGVANQWIDPGEKSIHPVYGLNASICERIVPCVVPDCPALACSICWERVAFFCFGHGVSHTESHIRS